MLLAEKSTVAEDKSFEDCRIEAELEGITMDTAFLYYDGTLFRVGMRYKNFKENEVIGTLDRLHGDPGGNSWGMICRVDDRTSALADVVDDTVAYTERIIGEAWGLEHQKMMQEKGYRGKYGGG